MDIHEADEPDTCRWCDLDSTGAERIIRRICSLVVTFGMTLLSILTLPLIRVHINTIFYSVILSTYNIIIPLVVQAMVSFEKHPDEGDKQQSLYINIALFRWVSDGDEYEIIQKSNSYSACIPHRTSRLF